MRPAQRLVVGNEPVLHVSVATRKRWVDLDSQSKPVQCLPKIRRVVDQMRLAITIKDWAGRSLLALSSRANGVQVSSTLVWTRLSGGSSKKKLKPE